MIDKNSRVQSLVPCCWKWVALMNSCSCRQKHHFFICQQYLAMGKDPWESGGMVCWQHGHSKAVSICVTLFLLLDGISSGVCHILCFLLLVAHEVNSRQNFSFSYPNPSFVVLQNPDSLFQTQNANKLTLVRTHQSTAAWRGRGWGVSNHARLLPTTNYRGSHTVLMVALQKAKRQLWFIIQLYTLVASGEMCIRYEDIFLLQR